MENKDLIFLIGKLVNKIDSLEGSVKDMNSRLRKQEDFVNRWKGGAFILMGIGAAATWVIEQVVTHFR